MEELEQRKMSNVVIVSCDKVFSRMLELELGEIGLKPKLICERFNLPALNLAVRNTEWVIFDGDYYENDISFTESFANAFILFDRIDRTELPKKIVAHFKRPFSIAEFTDTVAAFCGGTPSVSIPRPEQTVYMELDAFSKQVTVQGNTVKFSPKEFALLSLLYKNRGRIVARREVIDTVWGKEYNLENNVDNVYINYLRKKLDEPLGLKLICTVRGKGYMMK